MCVGGARAEIAGKAGKKTKKSRQEPLLMR